MQISQTRPQNRPRRKAAKAGVSRLFLTIDQSAYAVMVLPRAVDQFGRAYRLVKSDGAVYDLAESPYGPACDCPDYVYRRDGLDPAGCKHIKALVRHGLIENHG